MFNTQLNYWNQMTDMLQENYKMSLKAGQEFQEGFASMLKEIMEVNMKNTMGLQKEFDKVTKKNVDVSMDMSKKFLELYTGNMKKGLDVMNTLFEKYSVQNVEFRTEMQDMWKENFDILQKKSEEFINTFKANHDKNVDTIFENFKTCSKGMEEFNKKLEKMAKEK